MSQALQDLLALQDIDLSIDQLKHRRDHLPEGETKAGLDRLHADQSAELAMTEASLEEVSGRQAHAEAELAGTETRAGQINQRMFGGQVIAPRDLQAMQAELDHLKTRSSAMEDTVIELMEERQPIEEKVAELSRSVADVTARRDQAAAALADAQAVVTGQLGDVEAERERALAAIPAPLLATYERLRGRLGGVGVARLVGNHCDGCHLTLSAVELEQVRHLPDGEVYTCEQCGRILVP
ncbi:MAG TPA: C4-type zinc ribbon domain-containing protein [Acidimicrobiales bacterium]|nr:C4-type zinc ribbon domain-containing protein [Acidimicrobiales bacterium]